MIRTNRLRVPEPNPFFLCEWRFGAPKTLRANGTLISEPRFSTPCEMQFFPREKGKMALYVDIPPSEIRERERLLVVSALFSDPECQERVGQLYAQPVIWDGVRSCKSRMFDRKFRPVQPAWDQDGPGWPPPQDLDGSETLQNKAHGESGRDPFGPGMGPGRAENQARV